MEHKEDRDSLKEVPTFTLPPPARFDAAATAAARPVETLPKARRLGWLHPSSRFLRINRRSRLLTLMAIVGLATGAAGGMLVVERDRQQRITSSSMIPTTDTQSDSLESATPVGENEGPASLEPSADLEPPAEPAQAQPTPRRSRRVPRRQLVVLADEERDLDEDDGEDKGKEKARDNDDDDRKDRDRDRKDDDDDRKDRDRDRKDRDRDSDSNRSERSRRGTILYDVIRARKP